MENQDDFNVDIIGERVIDSDLEDFYNGCVQLWRSTKNVIEGSKEAKEMVTYLEEQLKNSQVEDELHKETLRQTEQLVAKQQDCISKLLETSALNDQLKTKLQQMELTLKEKDERHRIEKDRFETDKKDLIAKYETEATHLLMKLDSQERDHEETVKKLNEDYHKNCNSYLSAIEVKENEKSELIAQHSKEIKKVKDVTDSLRKENTTLREKLACNLNTHQKVISQLERNHKAELENYKAEINNYKELIAQLQQQLWDEIQTSATLRNNQQPNIQFRNTPSSKYINNQPGDRFRREPSVQYRDEQSSGRFRDSQPRDIYRSESNVQFRDAQAQQNRGVKNGRQGIQFRDGQVPEDNLFLKTLETQHVVSQVSERLALQSLYSKRPDDAATAHTIFGTAKQSEYQRMDADNTPNFSTNKRSEPCRMTDDASAGIGGFSDEKTDVEETYPPLVKRKKLFSEKQDEFL